MGPGVAFSPTSTEPIDEPAFRPTSTQPIEEPLETDTGAAMAGADPVGGEIAATLGSGAVGAGLAWPGYIARSAVHGVGALLGYAVAGGDPEKSRQITDWLTKKHDQDRQAYDDIQNFVTYHPRTEQAQAALALPGRAVYAGLTATGASPETVESVEQAGGDVLRALPPYSPRAVASIPGRLVGAVRAGRAARATESVEATVTATPKAPSAVTSDQLRTGQNPIPQPNDESVATSPATLAVQKPKITPRAGESAQEAATRQGIPAQAPASSAPPAAGAEPRGRLFHPPQEDGPQYVTRASEADQVTRRGTLDDLNRLGGGVMIHDRRGAVTRDWEETGNEFQTSKIPDAPGQLLRDQIGSEHRALHNAAQGVADSVGSEALNNVDRDTLEQRGAVVRGAVHAIEDHFNSAANGLYSTARATLGDRPMASMPRVQQILSDSSHDVNPTAGSLRRAAQARLTQLWSVGDTRGNVRTMPGTVGAAERFHEFLNESFHNDSAGLIRKLKNATDMDVAERAGGNDLYQTARNVIRHRETMLEPDGVNELRRPKDRNRIDNEVGLHEVMDHVVNQDSEHFQHFMNVLRAGAHLSPEVAEKSAAAIREVQGHMVARLHTAARGDAGAWNATNFYKAANRFSTNMPHAFRENPQALEQLQTINRAGNILKMDKSYPGAVAQAAKVGLLPKLAEKGIKAVGTVGTIGGAAHGNLLLAGASHLAQKAATAGAEKFIQGRRLAAARESLLPRGKERGSVGVLPQRDAIEHTSSAQAGGAAILHYYTVPGDKGQITTVEHPALGHRQVISSEVDPSVRGQGWGTRMLQRAADDAHARGQVLRSDNNVSQGQAGAYANLSRLGYKVTKKDSDLRGGAYQAVGDHVFEVGPRQPSAYERSGDIRDLCPKMASVKPYYERGSVPVLNVGHHVGDPAVGGRVLSKAEVVSAIARVGGKISSHDVIEPHEGAPNLFEPTSVVGLKKALTETQGQALAKSLGQKAVAQSTGPGTGNMFVRPEHASEAAQQGWDKFNPDYFHHASGETETQRHPVLSNLTPEERVQASRSGAIEKLTDSFHNDFPEHFTDQLAAAALAGAAKRGWYRAASRHIGAFYGPDAPRFTAALAAQSPRLPVSRNFTNTVQLWDAWDRAGRPTDPAAIRTALKEGGAPPDVFLGSRFKNTVDALTHPDPEKLVLSGPKVNSFYGNLMRRVHDVTLDGWMAQMGAIDAAKLGGSRNLLGPGKSGTYLSYSAHVRAAAKRVTELMKKHGIDDTWTPEEIQETGWSWFKTAFEHAEKTGESVPELMRRGEINDKLVAAAPDFHTLFGHADIAHIIGRNPEGAARLRTAQSEPALTPTNEKARAAALGTLRPRLRQMANTAEKLRQTRLGNINLEEAPF